MANEAVTAVEGEVKAAATVERGAQEVQAVAMAA